MLSQFRKRARWRGQTLPEWVLTELKARFAATPWIQMIIRASGRRLLLCIGDSHLKPVLVVDKESLLPKTVLAATIIEGATASGLANPNSATQAYAKFKRALRFANASTTVLVSLGEVDAGFLVFLRAGTDGDPRAYTDDALGRFRHFLQTSILDRGVRLVLVSAIMPVVEDYSTWDGLNQARSRVTATLEQRASETCYWNERCREWADEVGATWLDLTPHIVGSDGRVLQEWTEGPNDHHLNLQRHAELMANLLRVIGFE